VSLPASSAAPAPVSLASLPTTPVLIATSVSTAWSTDCSTDWASVDDAERVLR